MNDSPLFTVVTVVYNGEKHLAQAIKSVVEQGFKDFEYIIIDGGSVDGSLDIIRRYEDRIDGWVSESDKGIFDAMNKGIAKSTGRFIGFLNADDWYEPDMLERMKEKIDQLDGAIENRSIYSDYYTIDEELFPGSKAAQKSEMKYWKGMTVSHQSMFVHRFVYEKLGLFDLQYRFASDYEYFLRMIHGGVEFDHLDYYGVNFRKGGASTQHMNRSIGEVSRIVRKYYGIPSKEYVLFLITNRLPSMKGNMRRVLSKVIGIGTTNRLRRLWRRL
jgi:glycosyltransferase involved in cell wall biosynthesis